LKEDILFESGKVRVAIGLLFGKGFNLASPCKNIPLTEYQFIEKRVMTGYCGKFICASSSPGKGFGAQEAKADPSVARKSRKEAAINSKKLNKDTVSSWAVLMEGLSQCFICSVMQDPEGKPIYFHLAGCEKGFKTRRIVPRSFCRFTRSR